LCPPCGLIGDHRIAPAIASVQQEALSVVVLAYLQHGCGQAIQTADLAVLQVSFAADSRHETLDNELDLLVLDATADWPCEGTFQAMSWLRWSETPSGVPERGA
jgi:hypothetical protein